MTMAKPTKEILPVGRQSPVVHGFPPFYDGDSKLLILGSFPSVKSRQTEFYYGNRQNRFWRILARCFGAAVPETVGEKQLLLKTHGVALWDIVTECEIVGSQDSTIKNYKVADLGSLLPLTQIRFIIVNGGTAGRIFEKFYADIGIGYRKLPSTSPANTKCDEEEWVNEIRRHTR